MDTELIVSQKEFEKKIVRRNSDSRRLCLARVTINCRKFIRVAIANEGACKVACPTFEKERTLFDFLFLGVVAKINKNKKANIIK